jgi:hypothetical protein
MLLWIMIAELKELLSALDSSDVSDPNFDGRLQDIMEVSWQPLQSERMNTSGQLALAGGQGLRAHELSTHCIHVAVSNAWQHSVLQPAEQPPFSLVHCRAALA